ncbi:hypothetical protein [Erwinia aphidicola]
MSGVVASGLALVTPAVEGGLKAGAVTVATVKGLGAAAGMISSALRVWY